MKKVRKVKKMPELKIKSCPFCGETRAENIISRGMNGLYFINHFDNIFWIKSSIGFYTESEAIEAWNRRSDNGKL